MQNRKNCWNRTTFAKVIVRRSGFVLSGRRCSNVDVMKCVTLWQDNKLVHACVHAYVQAVAYCRRRSALSTLKERHRSATEPTYYRPPECTSSTSTHTNQPITAAPYCRSYQTPPCDVFVVLFTSLLELELLLGDVTRTLMLRSGATCFTWNLGNVATRLLRRRCWAQETPNSLPGLRDVR